MKEVELIEFLQLVKSNVVQFDNSDSLKLMIRKNSPVDEIRYEINFTFEIIRQISSPDKKVNLIIWISSHFDNYELPAIESLLEPIYQLQSKRLVKIKKIK